MNLQSIPRGLKMDPLYTHYILGSDGGSATIAHQKIPRMNLSGRIDERLTGKPLKVAFPQQIAR